MRDRRRLIEPDDANERGAKLKRAGKLGQENEPAMQAQIPPPGHLPVESHQADDATPSERRSCIDVRNLAEQRGVACVFDELQ
jgi:hypothetical protein